MSTKNTAKLHNTKGYEYFLRKNYKSAERWFKKALSLKPNTYSLINLGATYLALKKPNKAKSCFKDALKIDKTLAVAHFNLASIAFDEEDFETAIKHLQKSVTINPNDREALAKLAYIYTTKGNLVKSKEYFEKIIKLTPNSPSAHLDLGMLLLNLSKENADSSCLDDAEKHFRKVIKINPRNAEACGNFGIILHQKGDTEKAIKYLKKSVKFNASVSALNYLGTIYDSQKNTKKAIKYYEKAAKLDPKKPDVLSNLLFSYMQMCNWKQVQNISRKLNIITQKQLKKNERSSITPFLSITKDNDLLKNLQVARVWSKELEKQNNQNKVQRKISTKRKRVIRVAYLSDAFREYPTSHNIRGVLEFHNRSKFLISAYSHGPNDNSIYRKNILKVVDRFVDIQSKTYDEVASNISKNVDILVDLKGYTKGNRLAIFALKPAPVQISWLGFPGTTGANFIDYMVVDKVVVPLLEKKYYSEKLIYMPHTYRSTDDKLVIDNTNYSRSDFGFSDKSFIFSSFNQPYKITKELFDVWIKILHRVPTGTLWLWLRFGEIEKTLKGYASKKGISPDRIIFAKNLPKEHHLKRLQLTDLALDTHPVNGHTTTVDCLWAGVPVVTVKGNHFASRVSESVLRAVGLESLVTRNLKEYENLAVDLALYLEKLKDVVRSLKANRISCPLFNTQQYTNNLEKAYEMVWERYLFGKKPKHLVIS